MVGIYKITNNINGKVYIGKSVDIKERWKKHKRNYNNIKKKSYNFSLYQAIRKYGLDNFSFEVVEECKREQLNEKEVYWIKEYQSYPLSLGKGYNMTPGGECGRVSKIDIYKIINLLQNTDLSQQEIAKRENTRIEIISNINNGKYSWHLNNVTYPIRARKKRKKLTHCPICGNIMHYKSKTCIKCTKKPPIPSKLELLTVFNDLKYKVYNVAEYYRTSEKIIQIWGRKYGFKCQNKKILKELYITEVLGQKIEVKEKRSRSFKIAQIDPETNRVIQEFDTISGISKFICGDNSKSGAVFKSIKENRKYKDYKFVYID